MTPSPATACPTTGLEPLSFATSSPSPRSPVPGDAPRPDSTMQAVLEAFPGARRALFRRYHIGGCSSCGFQPTETLEQLCARNGNLSVEEVSAHIRTSHEQDLKLQIEPRALAAILAGKTRTVRLLDIRTREEWDPARIEGATLFSQEVLQEMLSQWPRKDLVVVYDHQGRASLDAAAYFQGHGFENVLALRGGIDAWSLEVDPQVPRYRLE